MNADRRRLGLPLTVIDQERVQRAYEAIQHPTRMDLNARNRLLRSTEITMAHINQQGKSINVNPRGMRIVVSRTTYPSTVTMTLGQAADAIAYARTVERSDLARFIEPQMRLNWWNDIQARFQLAILVHSCSRLYIDFNEAFGVTTLAQLETLSRIAIGHDAEVSEWFRNCVFRVYEGLIDRQIPARYRDMAERMLADDVVGPMFRRLAVARALVRERDSIDAVRAGVFAMRMNGRPIEQQTAALENKIRLWYRTRPPWAPEFN